MSSKGIYIVNPEYMLTDKFVAGDVTLDIEIRRAWRKHVFKGKDRSVLKGFDFRAGNVVVQVGSISFDNPAHESNYRFAIANGLEPVVYQAGEKSLDACAVSDWAAEARRHSPVVYAAMLGQRVSFAAMVEHARRWHEAKAKRAAKLKDRMIPRDDEGAPTVLELDGAFQGWRWVWLKTDEARDAEGEMMGHCVGDGSYDNYGGTEGVFSLRDADEVPHVTVELDGVTIDQEQSRGNTAPPARFRSVIDLLRDVVGARLKIMGDPTREITDGQHDLVVGGGDVTMWTEGGKLHREGGPAYINDGIAKYYTHGVSDREFRIHLPESVYSRIEFFRDGKLHREGAPAVVRFWPNSTEELEWYLDGERTEEDGSPYVEPKYFSRGYMFMVDKKPHFVIQNHRAKEPDPRLCVAINSGNITDTLRKLDPTKMNVHREAGRTEANFKLGAASYDVTFKKDGTVDTFRETVSHRFDHWGARPSRATAVFTPHGGPPQTLDVDGITITPRFEWTPSDSPIDTIFADVRLHSRSVLNAMETREAYLDAEGFTPDLSRWPDLAKRWEEWKSAS